MRCFLRFATVLMTLASASAVYGHGFTLGLSGNQLTLNSPTFAEDFNTIAANSIYSVDHGFVTEQTSPSNPFNAADTFRFDIISPLLYSNGGAAVAAGAGITMDGDRKLPNTEYPTAANLSFDGSTPGITPGYSVSGTDTHEVQWTVSGLTGSSDLGVYGFKYRLYGFKNGNVNDPYDPVDAIVALDTLGAVYSTSLEQARIEIFDALQNFEAENPPSGSGVVPEPATAIALVLGLGLVIPAARRAQNHRGRRSEA